MAVNIDKDKCDACMKCADICPQQALSKTETDGKEHIKVDPDLCIDCNLCIEECKDNGAITSG